MASSMTSKVAQVFNGSSKEAVLLNELMKTREIHYNIKYITLVIFTYIFVLTSLKTRLEAIRNTVNNSFTPPEQSKSRGEK